MGKKNINLESTPKVSYHHIDKGPLLRLETIKLVERAGRHAPKETAGSNVGAEIAVVSAVNGWECLHGSLSQQSVQSTIGEKSVKEVLTN